MVKELTLTKGKVALVDDDVFEDVGRFRWFYTGHYAGRAISTGSKPRQKLVLLHRHIMDAPDGIEVDHIDGNGLNCLKSNMRFANDYEQSMNRRKSSTTKSTPYKGVTYNKKAGKYKAQIDAHGEKVYLGWYDTPEEAAAIYNAACVRLHGEFACLNPTDSAIPVNDLYWLDDLLHRPDGRTIPKRPVSASGYRGVVHDKRRGTYRAGIKVDGKEIRLGVYATAQEAAAAYDEAARLYRGRAAITNGAEPVAYQQRLEVRPGKSGYWGVQFIEKTRRWHAHVTVNRKSIHIGSYATAVEAAQAFDRASWQHNGTKGRLNFPFAPPPESDRRITIDRVDPADLPFDVPIRVPC